MPVGAQNSQAPTTLLHGSNDKHLDPATSIHKKVWELKEPVADPGEKGLDAHGRKWQIKTWKLDGHEVGCRMS